MFCWFFFSPIKDFYADCDILFQSVAPARMSSYQQNGSSFQLDYRLTSSIYTVSPDSHHVLLYTEWSIDPTQDLSLYFFPTFALCKIWNKKYRKKLLNIMLDGFLKRCVLHARESSFASSSLCMKFYEKV